MVLMADVGTCDSFKTVNKVWNFFCFTEQIKQSLKGCEEKLTFSLENRD